ncbi:MAG: type II CRISPR RNA-guided endonuclease Cas9 [Lachnospiraceae bacterium]|nr:type II CRISPR RNA-guided endonuclease Cas9 [Lachnospiraceae bacterium]
MRQSKEYYLGLDMGTDSVGWAVTDASYHLLRAKGKDLWGIREFNRAENAADRRSHRVSRRRNQHSKERIAMLRAFFQEAVEAVDPDFFIRLDNSKYFPEDKDERLHSVNCVFDDPDYKDRNYFKQYPTIFHLRSELINNPGFHDVRLVYLALLNMFKHRGHFLNAELSSESGERNIAEVYLELSTVLEQNFGLCLPSSFPAVQVLDILSDNSLSRTDKEKQMRKILGIEKPDKKLLLINKLRGRKLIELYKSISSESKEWRDAQIAQIEKADENGSLRSKKLFLYYVQMGKDIYTGKPIDLHELFSNNKYDIDHIYPRHFVKDDNIANNLVLTNKGENNKKQDEYPLNSAIRSSEKVRELWDALHRCGLINDEKYKRLTRHSPFTEEEKAGFIARQLVETSQATKGVADLLKQLLPQKDTTIVYAKASNVSDFRHDFGFLKSRKLNDFHHAQDAYLNIVVGNAYFVKFTQNPLHYIQHDLRNAGEKYHLTNMFRSDIKRGNEMAWLIGNNENQGTAATVKAVMERNWRLCLIRHFPNQ